MNGGAVLGGGGEWGGGMGGDVLTILMVVYRR